MKTNWIKITEIDDVTIWTDGNNYFCSRIYDDDSFDCADNITYDSKDIIECIIKNYENKIKILEKYNKEYRTEIDKQIKKLINDKISNVNLTEYFKDKYENWLFIQNLGKEFK